MKSADIRELAGGLGFELAGVAPALPSGDRARYQRWAEAGFAGEMRYLTDGRAELRNDPRSLLASARSVICVGKLYNAPWPYSTRFHDEERAWISRYAWGGDYHRLMRRGLERMGASLAARLGPELEWRACVDTAPLLERSYARQAGLGWIGKNTCLINQQSGSWFFLGELLVSVEIEPDSPPPDRCGTCRRCIDACPTAAIVPEPEGGYAIVSRRCISYFTIELRGAVPEQMRPGIGRHIFGCDICQDVCPWNGSATVTAEPAFQPLHAAPPLARLAEIGEEEFRGLFRESPVSRARYAGFLRNVAVAMGNSGRGEFRGALGKLAQSGDAVVAEHAQWALGRLEGAGPAQGTNMKSCGL